MLKEFLDRIAEYAVTAQSPVIKETLEPDHVYWVRRIDGTLRRIRAAPQPREHIAGDLATLIDAAKRYSAKPRTVWYSRAKVVLVLDDTSRRDTIELPLELSPQIKLLQGLESSKRWLKQPELIRLLKIDLAGCMGPAGNLLDLVRKIQFRVLEAGGSTIQHGKASIGKSLDAELTGTGALPDYASFNVPVFAAGAFAHMRENIECALEIDQATQAFQIIPLPGCLEAALASAEAWLGQELRDGLAGEGEEPLVPVFYGQP